MPYIVTTKRVAQETLEADRFDESRRAVATLEEARQAIRGVVGSVPRGFDLDAVSVGYCPRVGSIGPQGCTVGPLPDGTVIAVEPTTYGNLAEDVGMWDAGHELARVEILAAFNAAQEVAA